VSGRVTVELGRVIPGWDDDPGRLVYLPRLGAVLATQCRTDSGWRCAVVARRQPRPGPAHVDLSYAEFATAQTTVTVDPVADPDGYAMVWQVRVRQQWTGGRLPIVAQYLAGQARSPHNLVVELDDAAVARLVRLANIFPVGLRNIVGQLVRAGLLEPLGDKAYTLSIPVEPDRPPGPVAAGGPPPATPSTVD
jgi:hypothetical protein